MRGKTAVNGYDLGRKKMAKGEKIRGLTLKYYCIQFWLMFF